MAELLFKEETFQILGAAFEVYNQLGNGFLEAVYQEAMEIECQLRGVPVESQKPYAIQYKDTVLKHSYYPDLIAYEKIIVELKSIHQMGANETCQVLNYLKATGLRLGLVLNFGSPEKLTWKRVAR